MKQPSQSLLHRCGMQYVEQAEADGNRLFGASLGALESLDQNQNPKAPRQCGH
jgi:hypothetical protein